MTHNFRAHRPAPQYPPSPSRCTQRFIFDHVTKTGGTSFHAALSRLFGAAAMSPPIVGRSLTWALKTYPDCQVISGHFINAPGDGWDGRHHLTLLRDPIDRVL